MIHEKHETDYKVSSIAEREWLEIGPSLIKCLRLPVVRLLISGRAVNGIVPLQEAYSLNNSVQLILPSCMFTLIFFNVPQISGDNQGQIHTINSTWLFLEATGTRNLNGAQAKLLLLVSRQSSA